MIKKQKINRIRFFAPYTGSKYKEFPIIWNYLPERRDMTVIDVFGGSGSVLYHTIVNDYGVKHHYNEKNEMVYNLHTCLFDADRLTQLKKDTDILLSLDNVKDIFFNNKYTSETVEFLFKTKLCYKGLITSKILDNTGSKVKYDLNQKLSDKYDFTWADKIKKYLKNTINFTNKDYKEILEQYKYNENAFIYLDPPYISKETNQYGFIFTINDFEYIHDFMDTCKCLVMLNVDYNGYTRERFNKFYKFAYPINYSQSNTKETKNLYVKHHLLLCNY